MFSQQPELVAASGSMEAGISAEIQSAASAAAPALMSVLPMGADEDSTIFCAALNAAGGEYVGVASEHSAQRGLFSGAQGLASATTSATEVERAAMSALG
jgi:hypothetical protein